MNGSCFQNRRLRIGSAILLQAIAGCVLGAIAPSLLLSPIPLQAALLLNFTGAMPAAAAEKSRIRWVPKQEQGKAKGTLSGGRRGQESSRCGNDAETTQLSLLVPPGRENLVTTSAHPTFSWQLQTQQPATMEFILSDRSQSQPVYQQSLEVSATQLTHVTLPPEVALKDDTRYRWTVIVDCPDGQKTEIYARSFIRKISGESLEQQLSPLSLVAQAAVFAENGVWYDAMSRLLAAVPTTPDESRAALADLLTQGLAEAMPEDLTQGLTQEPTLDRAEKAQTQGNAMQ